MNGPHYFSILRDTWRFKLPVLNNNTEYESEYEPYFENNVLYDNDMNLLIINNEKHFDTNTRSKNNKKRVTFTEPEYINEDSNNKEYDSDLDEAFVSLDGISVF